MDPNSKKFRVVFGTNLTVVKYFSENEREETKKWIEKSDLFTSYFELPDGHIIVEDE